MNTTELLKKYIEDRVSNPIEYELIKFQKEEGEVEQFSISFGEKVIGYLRIIEQEFVEEERVNRKFYLQFFNSDRTKSYLSDIFSAGILSRRAIEAHYSDEKDRVAFNTSDFTLESLFQLLHEYGHAFQSKEISRKQILAQAKLGIAEAVDHQRLYRDDGAWIDPLNERINMINLVSIYKFERRELLPRFTQDDAKAILSGEFDASRFALDEVSKLLIFIGLDEFSDEYNEIMNQVAEKAKIAYRTYQDSVEPYIGYHYYNELRNGRESWLENRKWQRENGMLK